MKKDILLKAEEVDLKQFHDPMNVKQPSLDAKGLIVNPKWIRTEPSVQSVQEIFWFK